MTGSLPGLGQKNVVGVLVSLEVAKGDWSWHQGDAIPARPGLSSYTEVANNVQKEETVLNIQFVMLDCSHLKFSLVQHCNEWQNKFTTLLKEMAAKRLLELHTYLKENAEK